jgi:sulfoxide reductase heme-binding subunit YedZ
LCFILDYNPILKTRRPLGLYAFFYAGLHFLIFIWLDYGLNWDFIKDGFLEKPFALVGFAAFTILLVLALTSTNGWKRRLGKTWKKVHKWVYAAGLLVIVHYVWVVKSDYREPLIWGALMGLLLLLRIPAIKWWARRRVDGLKRIRRQRRAVPQRLKQGLTD